MTYDFELEMPDDSVPMHGIAVVSFMNADGKLRYIWKISGDSSTTSIVGLLECVQFDMLKGRE